MREKEENPQWRENKSGQSEESREPGETWTFLTRKGMGERIRPLVLLPEQTRRSSCLTSASKALRQLHDQACAGNDTVLMSPVHARFFLELDY